MDLVQVFHGLQLHQNKSLDNQIRKVVSDNNAVVQDGDWVLLGHFQADLSQFVRHCILIDLLKKTTAKFISDAESAAKDLLRDLIQSLLVIVLLLFLS